MKKKGQIVMFMLIAIVLVISFSLIYFLPRTGNKANDQEPGRKLGHDDEDVVINYIETCFKKRAENLFFDKIGPQGGYIDMENGIDYSMYQGEKIPVYLEASCTRYCNQQTCDSSGCYCDEERCTWTYQRKLPDTTQYMDDVSLKIENHLKEGFIDCIDEELFEELAMDIESLQTDPDIDVKINEEDVSINVEHKLKVSRAKSDAFIGSFKVNIPIRVKALYEGSLGLLNNIEETTDTEVIGEVIYDISGDCGSYDKNGMTNVYSKDSDDQSAKIVQFVDFSTYGNGYFNSYIFQFAVRGVDVQGNCVG